MDKRIEHLNQKLLASVHEHYPFGLAQGKMGLVIYFYCLHRALGDERAKRVAEDLLDQLMGNDLSKNASLDVEEGLCGVGLGLDFLIREGFAEGDINALLGDIDALLFKRVVFGQVENHYSTSQIVHMLYYVATRLRAQATPDEAYVYQELAIKLVNKLDTLVDAAFYREYYAFSVYHYQVPVLLRVLAEVMRLGFYRERTRKILERFSLDLFSQMPRLHLNRLYLLWGVWAVEAELQSPAWTSYAEALYRNIDLTRISREELRERHIYASDGLSFFYALVENLRATRPGYRFDYSPREVYERLTTSDAWDALLRDEFYFQIHRGLLNGFPGVVLTLLNLKSKYLCE